MWNKCQNYHSKLFSFHNEYNLDKNTAQIFTGFCEENVHKLQFFCKTHNKLYFYICISKIKIKGKCQYTDCEICSSEAIKEEKKTY